MEKEQLAHAPAWWVWLPCALEDPIPHLASSAIPEFSNKKPTCQQTSEAVLLPSPAAKHSLPHPDARAPLQPPGDGDAGAEGGTPPSTAVRSTMGHTIMEALGVEEDPSGCELCATAAHDLSDSK